MNRNLYLFNDVCGEEGAFMDDISRDDGSIDELEDPQEEKQPTVLKRVFFNRFGHWRAGWRLLVYGVAVFLVGKAITTPLKLFMPRPSEAPFASWTHSLVWVVGNVALIVAALALLTWFDRRPTGLLGLGFQPGWLRESALGLIAGVASTGLIVVVLIASGSVALGFSENLASSLAILPRYLFLFTMAATLEELVFRGYPLQVLAEGSRRWLAAVVLCMLFTWGHFDNPDVTVTGLLNIFIIGILLAVLYFKTLRLWLPITFHLSWNVSQSWLWGFDVSGIEIEDKFFTTELSGAEWLTGGGFGLEGSVLTTVLALLVTGWLLFWKPLQPKQEMCALWESYPTGFGIPPEADDPIDAGDTTIPF
jgi:membrane protease YdiL (CAAX protease family)